MSNPTTPFSWQMPTATDLVTDLPADFEVFGQAVATSMADLLGGTTGQILSKTTNADMDFTWITNDVGDITGITATSPLTGGGTSGAVTVGIQSASTSQSGAVQLSDSTSTTSSVLASTPTATKAAYDLAAAAVPKSTVTAKGSIFTATASATPAEIAVGNNGETIVADSSTSTGLKWAAPSSGSSYVAGKNFVINGGFDIWQRGTSFASAANIYTADRWLIYRSGANLTTSRVATGDTTNLPNIQYATRLQRTASSTNLDIVYFMNMFETVNTIPLVGQTVTLSFYARRGANYSPTSNILNASVRTGTGTDQNWINGYTGEATPLTTNATLTTTWQRFTVSGTIATTANELTVLFSYTPTGTAGAADLVEITGVQLEVSASATAFSRACGTIQGELAACQRYYYRTTVFEAYGPIAYGYGSSGTVGKVGMNTTVTMRTKPSAIDYSAVRCDDSSGINITLTSITIGFASGNIMTLLCNASSGFTANRPVVLLSDGSSSSYVGLNSEL